MTVEEQVYNVYETLEKLSSSYTIKNKDLAFECIQTAINLKDNELEFSARQHYLAQLVFLNMHDKAIALFPWFLNYKKNNELYWYDYHTFVWSFKWIVARIGSYGKIPLEQVESVFSQFEKEVEEYGAGKKVIYYFRTTLYRHLGNLEKAEEFLKLYKRSRATSDIDDCYACQINNIADFWLAAHDYKKVIAGTKNVVNKKFSCDSVPKTTYPKVCMAYMMLGKSAKAEEFYQLSVKELRLHQPQIPHMSFLLFYVAKNRLYVQAKKLLDKQLGFSFETNADVYKLEFCMGCYLVFKKAAEDGIVYFKLKYDMPAELEVTAKGYEVAQLKDWYLSQINAYISLLDNRNGNSYYSDYFKYLEGNI